MWLRKEWKRMSWLKYSLLFMILAKLIPYISGQTLQEFEEEFIKIIQKIQPSVVKIEVSYKDRKIYRASSGIVLDQEGHAITVASAVKNCDSIQAYLPCGKKIAAQLLGKDCHTNLAVLKLDANDFIPVAKGYAEKLRVGSVLIAMGNPYGLKNSVSTGIVSGVQRCVWIKDCARPLTGLIQTTAPINPGDDGGLVVDSQGRFVGMAFSTIQRELYLSQNLEFSYIFNLIKEMQSHPKDDEKIRKSLEKLLQYLAPKENQLGMFTGNPSLVSQGINFILPSEKIYWVAKQIIEKGKVCRGWVGIKVKDTQDQEGVEVMEIAPQSPASQLDWKVGDRLLSFNGNKVTDSLLLLDQMSFFLSGDVVEIVYQREGKEQKAILVLGELPKN